MPDSTTKLDPRLAELLTLDTETLTARIRRDTERLTTFQRRFEALRLSAVSPVQNTLTTAEVEAPHSNAREQDPRQQDLRARRGKAPSPAKVHSAVRRSWTPLSAGATLTADGRPQLRVLVQGRVTDAELPGMLARAAHTTLCEASPDEIRALQARPEVEAIELIRPISAALDQVRSEVASAGAAGRVSSHAAGKGVIIGLVDFGIDFYHSDLRNEDGTTRLLGLYDMATGKEWTQEQINADLQSSDPYRIVPHRWDLQGKLQNPSLDNPGGDLWMRHGTHMAAVAAGNGNSGVSPAGLAPGAELLFVSLSPDLPMAGAKDAWGEAGFDQVVLGMRWILRRAAELGKPVVINLSLADYTGPHDGTSLHQEFLDGLQDSPGRVVVVASGNANELGGHIQRALSETLVLKLQVDEAAISDDAFELWIDGTQPVGLTLTLPGGATFQLAKSKPSATALLNDGTRTVQVSAVRVIRTPRSDQAIRVNLFVEGDRGLPTGEWSVRLSGTKTYTRAGERRARRRRVHGWLERCNAGAVAWVGATGGQGTLSDLATYEGLLTVGGTVKRLGGPQALISGISGCGPTRDGRTKPDIVAPAASVRMAEPHNRLNVDRSMGKEYLLGSGTGTSISTAIVSGAAAVLMSCRGSEGRPAMLSTRELRTLLQENAITAVGPDRNGPVDLTKAPSPAFGAGVLNLRGLCGGEDAARGPWIAAFDGDDGGLPRASVAFWTSPDIRVSADRGGARVEVRVRDGGQGLSEGIEVGLAWSVPVSRPSANTGTVSPGVLARRLAAGSGSIPWSSAGVSGSAGEGRSRLTRRADGGVATFTVTLPDGLSLSSLCWRAEVYEGGREGLGLRRFRSTDRNRADVGLRKVLPCPPGRDGRSLLRLHLAGSTGRQGIAVIAEGGAELEAVLVPRSLLFDRDWSAVRQDSAWNALASFGARGVRDVGVEVDESRRSWIRLRAERDEILLPDLELEENQLVPVQVRFRGGAGGLVHVVHLVDAVPVGGVSGQSEPAAAASPD